MTKKSRVHTGAAPVPPSQSAAGGRHARQTGRASRRVRNPSGRLGVVVARARTGRDRRRFGVRLQASPEVPVDVVALGASAVRSATDEHGVLRAIAVEVLMHVQEPRLRAIAGKAKIVELALERAEIGVAKVLRQHVTLHPPTIDDLEGGAACVPAQGVLVARVVKHVP